MIPVRVPVDAPIHTVGGVRTLEPNHPGYHVPCPVCDHPAGGEPVTLVLAGIDPADRKDTGWTVGGAVIVHATCAGVTS